MDLERMSKDDESSSEELLGQEDAQALEEMTSPNSAFANISIPPYMVRRYVREKGLNRTKLSKGGLGFEGEAYTSLALSYSFIITKLLAGAKEVFFVYLILSIIIFL